MRVDVDEPRRDNAAGGVDDACRLVIDPPDARDAPIMHAHVRPERRQPGSVDDATAANDDVQHDRLPNSLAADYVSYSGA